MKTIEKIKIAICPEKYICGECKKTGDITNMVYINGLFHAKCYKLFKIPKN